MNMNFFDKLIESECECKHLRCNHLYYSGMCSTCKCKTFKEKFSPFKRYCECGHADDNHYDWQHCYSYISLMEYKICNCVKFATAPILISKEDFELLSTKEMKMKTSPKCGLCSHKFEEVLGFEKLQPYIPTKANEVDTKQKSEPLRVTKETAPKIVGWAHEQRQLAIKFEENGDLANASKYYTIAFLMFQAVDRFLAKSGDDDHFPNLPPNCS